jgi:hypothetical protein
VRTLGTGPSADLPAGLGSRRDRGRSGECGPRSLGAIPAEVSGTPRSVDEFPVRAGGCRPATHLTRPRVATDGRRGGHADRPPGTGTLLGVRAHPDDEAYLSAG